MSDPTEFARQWLYDVLPETSGRPLYILSRSGARMLWNPFGGVADGHVLSTRSPHVQRHLEAFDSWRGAGFVCIYDDALPHLQNPVTIRNLAMHEYAHYVLNELEAEQAEEMGPVEYEDGLPDPAEVEAVNQLYQVVKTTKPWLYHGCDFVRIMLHTWHRALARGRPICDMDVWCGGPGYSLSPVREYYQVLTCTREMDELLDEPLLEVARLPVPPLLQEFFDLDTKQASSSSLGR